MYQVLVSFFSSPFRQFHALAFPFPCLPSLSTTHSVLVLFEAALHATVATHRVVGLCSTFLTSIACLHPTPRRPPYPAREHSVLGFPCTAYRACVVVVGALFASLQRPQRTPARESVNA